MLLEMTLYLIFDYFLKSMATLILTGSFTTSIGNQIVQLLIPIVLYFVILNFLSLVKIRESIQCLPFND